MFVNQKVILWKISTKACFIEHSRHLCSDLLMVICSCNKEHRRKSRSRTCGPTPVVLILSTTLKSRKLRRISWVFGPLPLESSNMNLESLKFKPLSTSFNTWHESIILRRPMECGENTKVCYFFYIFYYYFRIKMWTSPYSGLHFVPRRRCYRNPKP